MLFFVYIVRVNPNVALSILFNPNNKQFKPSRLAFRHCSPLATRVIYNLNDRQLSVRGRPSSVVFRSDLYICLSLYL